jgi:hypothetical protein
MRQHNCQNDVSIKFIILIQNQLFPDEGTDISDVKKHAEREDIYEGMVEIPVSK